MELVTDALLVCPRSRDEKVQGLFSGITGSFSQYIIKFSIGLGVDFIQDKAGHIQAMFCAHLCGKHLVESGIAVIDDPLCCCGYLGPLKKCW